MSEIHLLNCCKCGENGAPMLRLDGPFYTIECVECYKVATPKFTTPEEAVAWWNGYNTNPPQETTKLKLLEAKDALKTLADYTATHFPEDYSCDEMAAIAYKAHEKLKEIEVNHSEDERIAEPLTNGDRIRAMSNKELAEYMSYITECDDCPVNKICYESTEKKCKDMLLDWLNSPADSEVK